MYISAKICESEAVSNKKTSWKVCKRYRGDIFIVSGLNKSCDSHLKNISKETAYSGDLSARGQSVDSIVIGNTNWQFL